MPGQEQIEAESVVKGLFTEADKVPVATLRKILVSM